MAGNGSEWIGNNCEWLGMAWEWLQMNGNGWKWMGMDGNGWEWLRMDGNDSECPNSFFPLDMARNLISVIFAYNSISIFYIEKPIWKF